MPEFKYVGEFDEVIVPIVGSVKQGESKDFPEDLAAGVNSDWEAVSTKADKKAATSEETV